MNELMSAAGEPWLQISLHAVKSDPHYKSTPRPAVQNPPAGTQKTGLSFSINPRRSIPQRPALTAIRSADNDFHDGEDDPGIAKCSYLVS